MHMRSNEAAYRIIENPKVFGLYRLNGLEKVTPLQFQSLRRADGKDAPHTKMEAGSMRPSVLHPEKLVQKWSAMQLLMLPEYQMRTSAAVCVSVVMSELLPLLEALGFRRDLKQYAYWNRWTCDGLNAALGSL